MGPMRPNITQGLYRALSCRAVGTAVDAIDVAFAGVSSFSVIELIQQFTYTDKFISTQNSEL